MSDTVIISLAPVAADCPRVIPEELAQEILASVEYGAAIVKPDNSGLYRRRLFAVHRRTLRAPGLLRSGDGVA